MQTTAPKSIVIVGGGTAGWMAASILLHAWKDQGVQITLVESDDIGIIGVGEGSTPALRKFFGYLRIAEKDWMPACNATYKAGIYFDNWSSVAGYESYFHPFYTAWDQQGAFAFVESVNKKRQGLAANAHPNNYFLAWHLAQANKAPLPVDTALGKQVNYGYHFDSHLLGQFLRARAKSLGLIHIVDNVTSVALDEQGAIAAVNTQQHGPLTGDFFIDCTGFAALLIGKTLNEPFISFKDNLFNDAAVTIPTAIGASIPAATRSTALGYGWAWQIPLTNRYGNGYVYSSDFISAEQAEQELRKHLGAAAQGATARHLKMRVGRVEQHWKKNCLAVGLSQGFIEPLEATALAIVQSTLENFVDCFDQKVTDKTKDRFNAYINNLIDNIRDYIVTHYLLNTRTDTDYWQACRTKTRRSEKLTELFSAWDKRENVMELLFKQERSIAYKPESWFCIFAGMGRFTATKTGAETEAALSPAPDTEAIKLQAYLMELSQDLFIDHRARLSR